MDSLLTSLFKFIAYIPSDDPDLGDDIVHPIECVKRALSGIISTELILETCGKVNDLIKRVDVFLLFFEVFVVSVHGYALLKGFRRWNDLGIPHNRNFHGFSTTGNFFVLCLCLLQ